jgi:hypothetical protein
MSEQAMAGYDALQLAVQQTASADGMTAGELHTLAYLGCLLSVYDGHNVRWWGYRFTATRAGAPFAYALDQALTAATDAGLLIHRDRTWTISASGRAELEQLDPLVLNHRRRPYLNAAAGTALAMPLPSVASALSAEPGLRRALRFVRTRELLDETGVSLLDDQFTVVSEALKDDPAGGDLMVPAVVWLTYLARMPPSQEAA